MATFKYTYNCYSRYLTAAITSLNRKCLITEILTLIVYIVATKARIYALNYLHIRKSHCFTGLEAHMFITNLKPRKLRGDTYTSVFLPGLSTLDYSLSHFSKACCRHFQSPHCVAQRRFSWWAANSPNGLLIVMVLSHCGDGISYTPSMARSNGKV